MNWEQIDKDTWRARVHKGWLVKHYEVYELYKDNNDIPFHKTIDFAICFVPDPMHSWAL